MTTGQQSPRDALWQLVNAYQVSQAIHVAASLGLADLLSDGARDADDLAEVTGSHPSALYRLLRALASVGIFEEIDGRFSLTPLSQYLRTDAPGSLRAWATYIGRPYHWNTWGQLSRSLQTGQPAFQELHGMTNWEYKAAHPEESTIFNAAMTGLSSGALEAVVRSYDYTSLQVLADVGGGEGALLAAILAANPHLRGILFDLPHVAPAAKAFLAQAGLARRCQVLGGSFFEGIPAGADAYLLKSVIHDWSDPEALAILRACRAALGDSGRLLLVERIVRSGNEPDPTKFSDLNMLVLLGGRERTADEFESLYAQAGFRLTSITHTGSPYYIIEGTPV